MRFTFTGQYENVMPGLLALQEMLNVEISERSSEGVAVEVRQDSQSQLVVTCRQEAGRTRAVISYTETVQFFRGFGLLVEHLRDGNTDFEIKESPQFTTCGAMFDVSQGNAVINLDSVKEIIRRMAVMGLNMLMLYCEDSYTVEAQPYFGYMRARYTEDDIRQLDDYAWQLGIELIPCIQTLGHLNDALRWDVFQDIREDDSTLLVGEEKTYAFIEDLITAATKPFRTKRIHIGMDEAWYLGRREYLTRNGYEQPYQIMCKHLDRVMEIVRKHGFKPMMWSDMFFSTLNKDGGYRADVPLPEGYVDKVPKDVSLVYWDYYAHDDAHLDKYIDIHRLFGEPIFAGASWTWFGFGLNWGVTERATHAALTACKHKGVKEVFMTVWGDCGTECNIFAVLPGLSLYAEHFYSSGKPSPEKLQKRFEFCTGGRYEDFTALRFLDETPGIEEGNYEIANTSKLLMWQDILTGLFDKNIEGLPLNAHYAKLKKTMDEAATRNGVFNFLFEFNACVADVLSVKSELGLAITAAYKAGDREAMGRYAGDVLPDLAARVKALRTAHKRAWFGTYKPLGWDVMDIRYGALLMRIQSAQEQITDWLEGRLPQLDELEEPRLYFNGSEKIPHFNYHGYIASPSRFSMISYF